MTEYTLTLPAADAATLTIDLAAGTARVQAAKGARSLDVTLTDWLTLAVTPFAVGGAVTVTGRKPA